MGRIIMFITLIVFIILILHFSIISVLNYKFNKLMNNYRSAYNNKRIKPSFLRFMFLLLVVCIATSFYSVNANSIYFNTLYNNNSICAFDTSSINYEIVNQASNIIVLKVDEIVSVKDFDVLNPMHKESVEISYYQFTIYDILKGNDYNNNLMLAKRDVQIAERHIEGCYSNTNIDVGDYYLFIGTYLEYSTELDVRYFKQDTYFEYTTIRLNGYIPFADIDSQNQDIRDILNDLGNYMVD